MKKVSTFIATAFCFLLYGQNTTPPVADNAPHTPYFLTLNDGKKIESNYLRYEDSYTREGFLIIDNKEQYNLRDVKDYQIREGYYKRMAAARILNGRQMWYKQEDPGLIKVYSQLVPRVINQSFIPIGQMIVPVGGQLVNQKHFYYQFGDQDPKKFRYADLLPLVKSDPKSLKMLQKGYSLAWLKAGLYVAGVASLIKGLSYGCDDKVPGCAENSKKGGGWLVGGLALPLVAFLVPRPEIKYRESVYLFNRD